MNELVRRRVFVEGRVQGVFYRAAAEREAGRLGLSGLARNLRDGRVELVVEGPKPAVDAFVVWARSGPPRADVTHVESTEEEPKGTRGFRVAD